MKNSKRLPTILLFAFFLALYSTGIHAQTYAAEAIWELTNPSSGGTGLTVVTSGPIQAVDEYLNTMEINQYTGPNESQRIRIAGNSHSIDVSTLTSGVYFIAIENNTYQLVIR